MPMKTRRCVTNLCRRTGLLLGLLAVTLAVPGAIGAQPKDDLGITLTPQKVVAKEGKEVLEPGERAKPGDVIQYTAVYLNRSSGVIRNLEPVLPIPAGMEYMTNTAKPKPARASLDGKRFERYPIKRKAKTADGKEEEREVAPAEYRAFRWFVNELEAGKSTNIIVRVKVLTTPRPAPGR